MIPLKEWLKSDEIVKIRAQTDGALYQRTFFRDPMRATYIDPTVFYSPADGIILYATPEVAPDEAVIEVKGRPLTVRDILDDQDYERPSLVVSIYMTKLDVHVNRVPTKGYLTELHRTPYLFTRNSSMLLEEEDILAGKTQAKHASYMFQNERRVMRVYCSIIKDSYYVIQVAEKDVDEIANWGNDSWYNQGERFGMIRFGSQLDVVLPTDGKCSFEVLAKKDHHVLAGVDPIIRIKK